MVNELNILAKAIARYEIMGVGMALRFATSTVNLPRRGMEGMACDFLLGHNISYDGVDEFQGVPAHCTRPSMAQNMAGIMDWSSECGLEDKVSEYTVLITLDDKFDSHTGLLWARFTIDTLLSKAY